MNIIVKFPSSKMNSVNQKKYNKIGTILHTFFKNNFRSEFDDINYIELIIKNFKNECTLKKTIADIKKLNFKLSEKYPAVNEVHYSLDLDYNLLIIGNGFDIAHNLNTQYTDFLNSCSNDTFIINNHEHNMKSNRIYLYLKEQKNQNGYWTNVEKAITDIVKFLEKIKITLTDNTPYELKELQALLDEKYYNFIRNFNYILCPLETNRYPFSYKFTNNFFNEFIKKLEYDLDSFINALEDYLLEIENTPVDKLINLKDINNIKIVLLIF